MFAAGGRFQRRGHVGRRHTTPHSRIYTYVIWKIHQRHWATGPGYGTNIRDIDWIREPFKEAGHGPESHLRPQGWATKTGSVSGRRAQVSLCLPVLTVQIKACNASKRSWTLRCALLLADENLTTYRTCEMSWAGLPPVSCTNSIPLAFYTKFAAPESQRLFPLAF